MNSPDQSHKNTRLAIILIVVAVLFALSSIPFWQGIAILK